ncbi:MAG: AMP-binding protein [Pyrinomonadaceae bacterium]
MHDTNLLEDQPIAWTPSPEVIERAQLTRFMKQVRVATFDELYKYSISDVEKFTEEVLKFLDIKFDPPYGKLLDLSDGPEFPNWFGTRTPLSATRAKADKDVRVPSAGLNITEICLDRWQTDEMKDQPAVFWEDEQGDTASVTYHELFESVESCAVSLRKNGLGYGDAIVIHLPMMIETVIALLATNRIGAVAVPIFSGYGVSAIESRVNAVGAKAIFTGLGFVRRGKAFDSFEIATQAISNCPTIKNIFVIEGCGDLIDGIYESHQSTYKGFGNRLVEFDNLIAQSQRYVDKTTSNQKLRRPEPTVAEDPLIILYTSGTTGKPKGIAHTHASFPIKAAQDMAFGTDVGNGTRISWYTDIGWMMGPWLIYGALINGATICIYDGAPDYPTPDRMWEFCAKHKVEVLGISPTLIRSLAAHEATLIADTPVRNEGRFGPNAPSAVEHDLRVVGVSPEEPAIADKSVRVPPHQRHDLSSLRLFASTGEPWNPAPWWWLFEKVGNSKLPIINYSGGTEISGGILMGNPLLSQKPCSFPAPCPGMDVDILDENGNPVGPNEVGELVIKQPWIGMARGFWQEKERYLETYWSRFKNIWVHGDWAMRDSDGHYFILGRSDDTLKVAGKRVGPAEVESLLVAHPLVTEAAVIGVPDEAKGTAMVAFCVLGKQAPLPASLPSGERIDAAWEATFRQELKALVARDMGKPLTPSKIHFVFALPKTRNAKVMRRVIRSAYLGEDLGDLSALENPEAVNEIRGTNPRQVI